MLSYALFQKFSGAIAGCDPRALWIVLVVIRRQITLLFDRMQLLEQRLRIGMQAQ
jgi:hypothetical protein